MSKHLSPAAVAGVSSRPEFEFTVFPRVDAPDRGTRHAGLAELIRMLREPRRGTKEEQPCWAPATFDGSRKTENVEKVSGLVFDVDEGDVPPAREVAKQIAAYRGIVHTSSSHTPEAPRLRVLILLSRPVDVDEHRRLWRWCYLNLPCAPNIARGSKDAARQCYFPVSSPSFEVHELTGEPLDVDRVLELEPDVPEGVGGELPADGERWLVRDTDLEDGARVLARHFVQGKRHTMSLAIAGACRWSGLSEKDAHRFLCLVAKHGPEGNEDPEDRAKTVRRTYALADEGRYVTGWPTLRAEIGDDAGRARDLLHGVDRWRRVVARLRPKAANDETPEPSPEAPDAKPNPLRIEDRPLDAEDEPVDWLVKGLIPAGGVCMFAAEPGTNKSWAALDIATCVAHGRPWLGKHATKRGRALYVNFDMPPGDVRRRLRLLGDDGSVARASHPDVSLDDVAFWEALEEQAPAFVVVDTLSAGNPEADENDPRAANPLRRAASMAARTGTTFLFLHHTTKDSTASKKNRVRGTGAILGAVDAYFLLESVGTDGATSVSCAKFRVEREPEKFFVRLVDETRDGQKTVRLQLEGETATTKAAKTGKPADLYAAIRLRIATNGPDVPSAIAKGLGRARDIRDACRVLVERGELVIIDRRHHLDGPKEREARVLAAVRSKRLRTVADVAKAAHVKPDDVRALVDSNIVWKTSETDEGVFACRPDVPSGVLRTPGRRDV